jgi:hypothetical protein
MMGKMKKLMKNLEGVGMNTNKIKILITGLREGHQMNRTKKLYRSMLLSFPTIVLTFFLLFCLLLFANLAIADSWSPKAQQWQSVGGKLVSSDTHSFNTFWYAAGNGMYWKDDEDQGKVPPRHSGDEVSKDILVKKGQITVRGPGFLGRVTRTKGSAGAYLKEPKAKTRFISATLGGQEMYKEDNKWTGKWVTRYDMNDFDPGKHHSGWVPANTTVTLDIWAVSYWSECGHWWRGFAAPKEVEYEFWFFPREGGEVINVTKYGPDGKEIGSDLEFKWSVNDNPPVKQLPEGELKFAGNAGETMSDEATYIDTTQTEKEIITARLAVIERLSPEERKKHRDEHVRLWAQLYLMNSREDAVSGFLEDSAFVADKTLGYVPVTSTVWGIFTGTIQLIRGKFKDATNRYLGAIPLKNLGTAYSAVLDILSLFPPINYGEYGEYEKWDPLSQPIRPDNPAPVIFLNQ